MGEVWENSDKRWQWAKTGQFASTPALLGGHCGHVPSPRRGECFPRGQNVVQDISPPLKTQQFEEPAHWNDWSCQAQLQ